MTTPNEYTLVEKPILDTLAEQYGYRYIHPNEHPNLRARENEVLFKPLLIDALVRINNIPKSTVEAVFNGLAGSGPFADAAGIALPRMEAAVGAAMPLAISLDRKVRREISPSSRARTDSCVVVCPVILNRPRIGAWQTSSGV